MPYWIFRRYWLWLWLWLWFWSWWLWNWCWFWNWSWRRRKNAEQIVRQFDSLAAQRSNWESHWQEVGDYIIPRKADITKARSGGDKRSELVFDGTALHAAELLSASLHGMLTNSSTAWFSLRFRNAELDGNDEAKEWLQSVEDVMYLAFSRSNFHEQVHELYHDLITFGTAVMFIENDPKYQLQFSTRHISECYLSEDEKGRVDTVYRKFKMPNRAVLQRFGKDVLSTRRLTEIKRKTIRYNFSSSCCVS